MFCCPFYSFEFNAEKTQKKLKKNVDKHLLRCYNNNVSGDSRKELRNGEKREYDKQSV